MNYSTTQAGNISAIVGVVVLVLAHYHINIASEEIMTVVGAAISLIGAVSSWVSRYRKGDLTISGFRKS